MSMGQLVLMYLLRQPRIRPLCTILEEALVGTDEERHDCECHFQFLTEMPDNYASS